MFELNKYMDLDGHNRGNIGRYINDPGSEGRENVRPRGRHQCQSIYGFSLTHLFTSVCHVQGNHRVEIRASERLTDQKRF